MKQQFQLPDRFLMHIIPIDGFPVASFLKKRYTIYSLENTRITGGLQHDRSNELWRCGNSSR